MTLDRAPASPEAGAPASARLRSPAILLNLVGAVLVGISLIPDPPRIAPATVIGAIAVLGWVGWVLTPPGRVRTALLGVAALTAAIGAGSGSPALIAPVIAALVVSISDPALPPRELVAGSVVVGVALAVAASVSGHSLGDLLSLGAGFAFGVLGGITRRQRRIADERERELLTASLAAEREAERAQLLEARSAAARDVHDVLAHSLGGLVLQLDAIEALLEHGRVEEAGARAAEARRLAGEGLEEARRAVAALRDPAGAVPATFADDALDDLVAAHRALGGVVEVVGDPSLAGVDARHREALAGALREALVNARRHAPGATARVRFRREEHAMVVRVTNPLASTPPPSVGGGHGLEGMRERFAALGDGSVVSAGRTAGGFAVEARAVLA